MCHCSHSDHAQKLCDPSISTISPSCLQDVLETLTYVLTRETGKTRLYTDGNGEQIMVPLSDDGQIHWRSKEKIYTRLFKHGHQSELDRLLE